MSNAKDTGMRVGTGTDTDTQKVSVNSSLPVPVYEAKGRDYWQSHIDGWSRSGLSQVGYCRYHDLDYSKFRKWKERISNCVPGKSSAVKLVEVKRDFSFNVNSATFGEGSCNGSDGWPVGSIPSIKENGLRSNNGSGIRFWCGAFCIEIDLKFSSESLSQLIRTLGTLQVTGIKNQESECRGCGKGK